MTSNFPVESITLTENIKDIDSISDSIPTTVIPEVAYGTLKKAPLTLTEIFWTDVVAGEVEITFDSIDSAWVDDFGKL